MIKIEREEIAFFLFTAVLSTDNAAGVFCTWMTKRSFLIK